MIAKTALVDFSPSVLNIIEPFLLPRLACRLHERNRITHVAVVRVIKDWCVGVGVDCHDGAGILNTR